MTEGAVSHDSDRDPVTQALDPEGPMLTWLRQDLMNLDPGIDWVIAYWHHPPYSHGSHNSDLAGASGGRLTEMREQVLPLLEAHGVDLVLTGHSHSYERSFLVDCHYDVSSALTPEMLVDAGDGRPAGDGAYTKPHLGPAAHKGAVYAVVGSSGRNDPAGGALDHPVMFYSVHDLGSMVLDVDGDRLDAVFIDRRCASMNDPACTLDSFTLMKGVTRPILIDLSTAVSTVSPGGAVPFSIRLENTTKAPHFFQFELFLTHPFGAQLSLVPPSTLGLPAGSVVTVSPVLGPLPAAAPAGVWTLRARASDTTTSELYDQGCVSFKVE